jgi:hypothetical protein
MPCIVSTDLPAPTVDADKQKVWVGGESFHQFMTRLAEKHDSYYTIKLDPESGKDTVIFIKKQDFEGKEIIADKTLTTYKAPGTLLRSVDIKIDFGGIPGNTQAGVNKEGKSLSSNSGDGLESEVLYDEQHMPLSPVGQGNEIAGARGLVDNVMQGEVTGTLDVTPTNTQRNVDDTSRTNAKKQERKIALDFTTIGFSKFTPGVIDFRNIGVRYSGKYRVITTTHTIDNSGYTTKGTALSFALKAGGIPNPEAQKGVERKDSTSDERLFIDKSTEDSTVASTVKDRYDRFIGIS